MKTPIRMEEGDMKSFPLLRSYCQLLAAVRRVSFFRDVAPERLPSFSRWPYIHAHTGSTKWIRWVSKRTYGCGKEKRWEDMRETGGEEMEVEYSKHMVFVYEVLKQNYWWRRLGCVAGSGHFLGHFSAVLNVNLFSMKRDILFCLDHWAEKRMDSIYL